MSSSVEESDNLSIGAVGAATDLIRSTEQAGSIAEYMVTRAPLLIARFGCDGAMLYVNEACCRVTGWTQQEILEHGLINLTSPDDKRSQAGALLSNTTESDQVNERDLSLRTKSGEIRVIRWRTINRLDENDDVIDIIGFGNDITAELEQERKLQSMQIATRDLQEYNEHIVQNSPMFVVGIAPDGGTRYINSAGCRISGYSPEQIIGKNLWKTFYPNEYYNQVTRLFSAFEKYGGVNDYEMTMVSRQGDERVVSWTSANRTDEHGKINEIVGIGVDITDLKRSQRELENLAHHDVLTGLPNRLYLSVRLELAIERAAKTRETGALLYIDLDRFKDINDTLGHPAGDSLLKLVAERLTACVRQDDIVARVGGDEFILLLENVGSDQNAVRVANKVIDAFDKLFELEDHEYHVTTSVGISLFPRDGMTIDALLKNADIAMYRAKDQGRNTMAVYAPALSHAASRRIHLENNLRKALARDEFYLCYQPQFDLQTNELIGAETLLRWQHPEDGLIRPDEFIPIAEESGLIIPIGQWVIENACEQTKTWEEMGLDIKRIAINIAGPQIQRSDLVVTCERVLRRTGLDPSKIELEVTEGFIMSETENSIETLVKLRELGVQMSIDDFGTGYSSLAYLKRLPIDQIKIDQSFVRDLPTDQDDIAIARTIIALGENLGLSVLAEGVETAEQRDFLIKEGCFLGQGYFYYKPMPANEFFDAFAPSRKSPVQNLTSA